MERGGLPEGITELDRFSVDVRVVHIYHEEEGYDDIVVEILHPDRDSIFSLGIDSGDRLIDLLSRYLINGKDYRRDL